jgi:hypothetical protein
MTEEYKRKLEILGINIPSTKPNFVSTLLLVKLVKKIIGSINKATQVIRSAPKLKYTIPYSLKYSRPKWYVKYQKTSFSKFLNFALVLILCIGLGIGGYKVSNINLVQKLPDAGKILGTTPAFPPVLLSYQGRLTDINGNPITKPTNVKFMIYADKNATESS